MCAQITRDEVDMLLSAVRDTPQKAKNHKAVNSGQ